MDEKKKWWKVILGAIGGFFATLFAFIFFGTTNRRDDLRDNRKRTNDIREQVETAGKLNTSAREHVEQLEDNIRDERQNIDECQQILANVRKRPKKRKD